MMLLCQPFRHYKVNICSSIAEAVGVQFYGGRGGDAP